MRRKVLATVTTAVVGAALALGLPAHADSGPAPAQNPYVATDGFAMQHGDTASSDTTPAAGPGPGAVTVTPIPLGATCPSVELGADEIPLATCTLLTTRQPTVFLLDPATGLPLASHSVTAGSSVLGGVYDYLDQEGRVVIVDGSNDLLRIGHNKTATGYTFSVDSTVPLGAAISAECGTPTCDTVVGLVPDDTGRVWFATENGLIGTVDAAGTVRTVKLPAGEQIGNSISSEDGWVAAVTDHALYLFDATPAGAPHEAVRVPYDRGTARKPGQLTDGSGTTPVFFGPDAASNYLAITDNARPHEDLLVYDVPTSHTAPVGLHQVCSVPVLTQFANSGTEDAPIGYDRTVIVNNTYGFTYPAGTTGTAVPATATFQGGMTRVDVNADGTGCRTVWNNTARAAGLPRLSTGDGEIQTVLSAPLTSTEQVNYGDTASYAAIDEATGKTISSTLLGAGPPYDALQVVGTTTPAGVMYQGTLTGLLRIAPAAPVATTPSTPGAPVSSSTTAPAVAGTSSEQRSPDAGSATGELAFTGIGPGLAWSALVLLGAAGAAALTRRRA